MKTLLLMRHAKSSWDEAGLADFDRPLNDRGRRAAPFMGEVLRREGLVPDVIVSSPAERARQTTDSVVAAGDFDRRIVFDENIYEASANALRQVAERLEESAGSAMLVGHNPGMEDFIRYLTGEIEPMPTAAVAVISLEVETWADVTGRCGRLEMVLRPRDLMK